MMGGDLILGTGLESNSVKNGMRFEDPWHRMLREDTRQAIATRRLTATCSRITLGNWLDVQDVVGEIAFISNKRSNQDPAGDSDGLTHCGFHHGYHQGHKVTNKKCEKKNEVFDF